MDQSGVEQNLIQNTIEVVERGTDGSWYFILDHPAGARRNNQAAILLKQLSEPPNPLANLALAQ